MTFEEVFAGAEIGAVLAVSNGKTAPPESAAFRYNIWRSHNFTGALLEKIDGPPRRLVIADAEAPILRSFTVAEEYGHVFTPITD